jgi:salicylate hydroxylase
MLYQLAVKEGAQIRFNTCVTEVNSSAASVTTESGETIFADVIIGADGYDSLLRQVVTDSEDEPPNAQDRHVIVTFTIPVHEMESDQDLRKLLNLSEVSCSASNLTKIEECSRG